MNGNRFGHRLALNLFRGRAVNLLEKIANDGELLLINLQMQIDFLYVSIAHVFFSIRFFQPFGLCCSHAHCQPFSFLFFSYQQGRVDFALLFTARAKPTRLLQILIDWKMSLKLDLNQLTNLDRKINKIILLLTF